MSRRRRAPCGSWPSPISAAAVAGGDIGLGECLVADGRRYWSESRPAEQGRVTILCRDSEGHVEDCLPGGDSAGSRVHEYGGGAFSVAGGALWFVNLDDQQIHCAVPGTGAQPLTAESGLRFADLRPDPARGRLLAVCEDHRGDGEPVNRLVAVDCDSGRVTTLVEGADFYSSPTLSPDGRSLAWLSWNHPVMPWDSTSLWQATLVSDGTPRHPRWVAGGPEESVCQPRWGPDGRLYFVSDRSGWWNLYRLDDGTAEALAPREAEFGQPHWVFGQSNYTFLADGTLWCSYCEQGLWRLARLDPEQGLEPVETPYTELDGLCADVNRLLLRAGAARRSTVLAEYNPASGQLDEWRWASPDLPAPGYLAEPEPMTFPTTDGARAHAFFYPPTHAEYEVPDDERPPLLVIGHGGPTSATRTALNLQIQYWTSRGFAVIDVNYRGSTGYGRAYHQALDGGWGVIDVADCVAAARHLIDRGRVDGERCAIRGKSAGGYSTLAALVFHDQFRAGASYYGISDLEILARDTHKFESRYLEQLVGPYPAARKRYRQRSPIHHIDGLDAPVIFFQGLEDRVVPPNQAEHMVEALRAKGLAVAYLAFPGERHGFRQADTVRRALEAELYFYARVFGFPLAENVTPVPIDNLPGA